jgi:thiosulfate reductase cytochrome b subunit
MTTGCLRISRYLLITAGIFLASISIACWAQTSTNSAAVSAANSAPHTLSNQDCKSCHAPRRIPVVDSEILAHSVHANLNCTDCHSDINSIPHPTSLQPVDCSACHRAVAHQMRMGAHAPASGVTSHTPTCTTCHGTHDIQKVDSVAFRDVIAQRCGACHQEHYQGYMDRFHGQAAALGMTNAPRCSDCHNPHRPLPTSNPDSRVAQVNLVTTCGRCHKDANKNFTEFDPHPQPWNRAHSALVYYCNLFMVLLLIGVFGFFGLHTMLWLQREFVAQVTHDIVPIPVGNQYVRRFTPFQIWMHVVVIISFMLLAMTGLPLKYASASWAQFLARLLGGEPMMRYIHLVCGGITFGYFFVHIAQVIYRFIKTRDFGIFYGVNSLVPRVKDFVDIFDNFRWFLYLGPRPKLDRWTYWEKFDYWAVFWGVAMIGFSGVMLAEPALAARLLPGQLLNVAAVVHGEEALLAVGFIFVFHFFHNHLRPENFPMDVTIFTGRLPLERFKEERPEQYARLVAEGMLDSMIVGPPSRGLVVLSALFGGMVVLIGLGLIIAVFVTMISNLG